MLLLALISRALDIRMSCTHSTRTSTSIPLQRRCLEISRPCVVLSRFRQGRWSCVESTAFTHPLPLSAYLLSLCVSCLSVSVSLSLLSQDSFLAVITHYRCNPHHNVALRAGILHCLHVFVEIKRRPMLCKCPPVPGGRGVVYSMLQCLPFIHIRCSPFHAVARCSSYLAYAIGLLRSSSGILCMLLAQSFKRPLSPFQKPPEHSTENG